MKHKRKSGAGRKTKKTPEVIRKLVAAFHNDYDLEDALVYASVSKTSYYDWLKKDKEFAEKISSAKHLLSMKCKLIIADRINNGDVRAAQWWLEHRRPEEFSLKVNFLRKREEFRESIIIYDSDNDRRDSWHEPENQK